MPIEKGSYAELHSKLVKKGYSYKKTVGKSKHYAKGKEIRIIKFTEPGRSAQRTNIRISKNVTQTRRHGTHDIYTIRKPKKRK